MATKKLESAAEPLALSPEEIQAVLAARQHANQPSASNAVNISELTRALVDAINLTKPKEKVKPYHRKKICRQCGRDHKENIKMKRVWFQHGGIELDPLHYCNTTIELFNTVKPGVYVNGLVVVTKRRDRAYDISWPVRTNAQRLRVIGEAGDTLEKILQRCIDERNDPRRYKGPEDDD